MSIAMLTGGAGAAGYYLERQAGCAAEYYTGEREAPGRWCGAGAAALGLSGPVAGEAGATLALLLDGRLPDGSQVARPLWRADPRGRLPAAPLVIAVRAQANAIDAPVEDLFAEPADAARFAGLAALVDRAPGRSKVRRDAADLGRLATVAGLDPHAVYRTGKGTDRYARTLRHAGRRVDRRRAGLDVVVSAPKSVSVLYALGGDDVVREVARAHERAVDQALAYLQQHTAHGLRGHQGDGQRASRIATSGFVAAAFTHRTSRADDPQLHTHLVIANLLHGEDGKWSAVDSRAVHRHARTAGSVYQAVLRGQLTDRLGVGWGPVRKGVAEVAGIPEELCREFSTRRRQIEAELDATGGDSRAARQRAAYRTRTGKTHAGEPALREQWAQRAIDLGHEPAELTSRVLGRQTVPGLPDWEELAGRLLGPDGLTAHATSFDQRDVTQALAEALPAGLPVDADLLATMSRLLLARDEVVLLAGPAIAEDGTPRYTTRELLTVERHALDWAGLPLAPRLNRDTVEALLEGAGLSGEQQTAARTLLRSDRTADVLIGPAGSGKTATLDTVARAWREHGHPVLGAALAAVTAHRLEQAAGIPATSLTRLLATAERIDPLTGRPAGLPAHCLVVVDEASMVGTRQLDRLLTRVAAAGGKALLVGDPAQLPEIEAGGLFTALARQQQNPARLAANHRQQHDWEREALAWLHAGHVAPALDRYVAAGRVHVLLIPDQFTRHVAAHYAQSRQVSGPYDTVVLASRRSDVAALNTAIRARLRADGRLGPDQLTLPDPHGQPLPLAVGDLVMVTRNDPARAVFNGTRGHITTADRDRIGLRLDSGQDITLPVDAVAGRLTHAYALTVHKAQGLTVDTCLLYGTAALCRQAGYVGLSRGRQENHLYTTRGSLDADRDNTTAPTFRLLDGPDPADVHDALIGRLRRTPRHVLAVDQQPRPWQRPQRGHDRRPFDHIEHERWQREHHGRDYGRSR
jgi:conjugative relaxase-like TrwC/TraI family protein